MRKTAAYVVALFSLFSFGLTILHPSYEALAAWLSPVMGGFVYTLFICFTLLVSDPLKYVAVGLVWVSTGLVIGLISQKKLGASITAIFVWLSMILSLPVSIFGIYLNLEAYGLFNTDSIDKLVEFIPIIPSQLKFASLFNIPIISELVFTLMETIPNMGEGSDTTIIIKNILTPYAIAFTLKPLLIILGAIIGAIIGKNIFNKINLNLLPTRKATTIGITLLIISQAAYTPTVNGYDDILGINLNDGIYTELIGGYSDNQGRAVTGELLLSSEVETIPSEESHIQGLAASIIMTQQIRDPSILYSLPMNGIENYLHLANILPETVAVTVYVGEDVELTSIKSDHLIEDYENLYGIQFTKVMSNQINLGESSESTIPPYIVSAYYSVNTLENTVQNLLTGFENEGGFTDSLQEKLNTEPLDAEIYLVGQMNPTYFETILPIPEGNEILDNLINDLLSETYHFILGLQTKKDAISSNEGYFDLEKTLGIGTPNFADQSDLSLLLVAGPNNTQPEPNAKASTNLPQDSMELMFVNMYLKMLGDLDIQGGTVPNVQNLRVNLPNSISPTIEVKKESHSISNGASVTLTITNEGDTTATNLAISDIYPEKYGILHSGSNKHTWANLLPGKNVSLNYEVEYSNPGVYTDIPAILSYSIGETTITTTSNTLLAGNKSPSAITLLSENYKSTIGLVDELTGKGELFQMVPLVFISLIAVVDVFKIYRNRANPDETSSEESFLDEPQEPEDNPEDPL